MVLEIFDGLTREWFTQHIGAPTAVQEVGWPAIASGGHVLISAPTGSGKTLSAFLVFIDRLKGLAREGHLKNELHLIYISPLKALGNDIRANLRRPLEGIPGSTLLVSIRTGDTLAAERRRMIKRPPHILITTPESLYLLLSSQSGRKMLSTAQAVIIDELHAVINSKRGAHLMLSLSRLDALCEKNLQRIGLSATIEPLAEAAAYLSPKPVSIVAPPMHKPVDIQVNSPLPDMRALPMGTIWPELAKMVYAHCQDARTVIAFVEGRAHAEKLSAYVNELGGATFSRTHHGSVSREQRLEAEQALRSGGLRLLCATSSMELGIDVGDVDRVLQIGNPRTISSTMQRLGRAGHNPGRTSVMHMFPRTVSESVYCGLTARLALDGGIEHSKPPRKCLDVLAQHLVSMAAVGEYTVDDVLALLAQTYNYKMVTRDAVCAVLRMLAGDFEHRLDHPVRPKLLYDRIHGTVAGDAYSRLLAVSAAGVIPDKGLYSVRLADGTKLGELDEEFVFEARVGDRFLLGAFAWKITEFTKDKIFVAPASPEGAQSPFWKGDISGRSYQTGLAFGRMFGKLNEAHGNDRLFDALRDLKLDDAAAHNAMGFLANQIKATGCLPDDKTIIVEHFSDQAGEYQIMVHSVFGRRVNGGLALLVQEAARRATGMDISCFDDDDGFMVFPYGGDSPLPQGLLQRIEPEKARQMLIAMLPATPLFNMAFRYNAGRALLMGTRIGKRQPLWITRLRSAEVLDNAVLMKDHPLILETRRECLEDYWDLSGIEQVLRNIASGAIMVRELVLENPSPMSLPLRRQAEATFTYDYSPTTSNVYGAVDQALAATETLQPDTAQLEKAAERVRLPEDALQLHSLMMAEGDLIAGDIDINEALLSAWLELLAEKGRAYYIEPGLWICAEQEMEYKAAFLDGDLEGRQHIIRRCLRYRGAQNAESLSERYFWDIPICSEILDTLVQSGAVVENGGFFYHKDLYSQALRNTVATRRKQVKTMPPHCYAALLYNRLRYTGEPAEQLMQGLRGLVGRPFPASFWESVLLPARVRGYRPTLLDNLLAQGEFFWQVTCSDKALVAFHCYEGIDWVQDYLAKAVDLGEDERIIVDTLHARGASFVNGLSGLLGGRSPHETLMSLLEKGLVHADSFVPVRQWMDRDKIQKASPKQRARARIMTNMAGRWELARPLAVPTVEEQLEIAFDRSPLLCRETAEGLNWAQALGTLRIWEYTGKVRRGYFIQGLSGAQFIREPDYRSVMLSMEEPGHEIKWLNAADPAQAWGRVLPHMPGRSFMCIHSTAVALCAGSPIAVIERHNTLRVFEMGSVNDALSAFAKDYMQRRIFPSQGRIAIKQYPAEAGTALETAGFTRQMQDYVLWQGYI